MNMSIVVSILKLQINYRYRMINSSTHVKSIIPFNDNSQLLIDRIMSETQVKLITKRLGTSFSITTDVKANKNIINT